MVEKLREEESSLSAAKYKAASLSLSLSDKPRRDSLMLFLGIKSYTNLLISKYQLLAASYAFGILFKRSLSDEQAHLLFICPRHLSWASKLACLVSLLTLFKMSLLILLDTQAKLVYIEKRSFSIEKRSFSL